MRARRGTIGPFQDGMPLPQHEAAKMMLLGVVQGAKVSMTSFERDYLDVHGIDPIMSTIVSGWLIRTWLAGKAAAA